MKKGRAVGSKDPKPGDFEFVEQYFWACVIRTNNCWLWNGPIGSKGYGRIRPFSKTGPQEGTHRYSYRLHYGKFDGLLQVCHRCDNPRCVRPDHLFLATNKENALDCLQKGRSNFNPNMGTITHLNIPKDIRDKILRLREEGFTYKAIGLHVDISKTIVRRVILGGQR